MRSVVQGPNRDGRADDTVISLEAETSVSDRDISKIDLSISLSTFLIFEPDAFQ